MNAFPQICVGTAKLGDPAYGFPSSARTGDFDGAAFLETLSALGISSFDTSPRYGESEKILGAYLSRTNKEIFISSKIDNLKPNNPQTPSLMIQSVQTSLEKLNRPYLDVCYLHQNELAILSDPYVYEGLEALRKSGRIHRTGASIYSEEECVYAIQSKIFDVVQLPVNIFDLHLYNVAVRETEKNKNIHLVARSLLLQGILENRDFVVKTLYQGREMVEFMEVLDALAKKNETTPSQLALCFAFSLPGLSQFIIGSLNAQHVREAMTCSKQALSQDAMNSLLALASTKKEWANPRNWRKLH